MRSKTQKKPNTPKEKPIVFLKTKFCFGANFIVKQSKLKVIATNISCPTSTPRLNEINPTRSSDFSIPISDSTLAKPKPWSKPKKITIQMLFDGLGLLLNTSLATSAMEIAIQASTGGIGIFINPKTANAKVIEYPNVKAVISFINCFPLAIKHRANTKAKWSHPSKMCSIPKIK